MTTNDQVKEALTLVMRELEVRRETDAKQTAVLNRIESYLRANDKAHEIARTERAQLKKQIRQLETA